MRCAVYARKSTAQDVAQEEKSVIVQIEDARGFATARGWTVAEDAVFADDAISGAEFERRPAFMALMARLQPRPTFAVLLVSELKSLGREMSETQYVLKQLAQAGVEVWGCMENRCLTPRNLVDKFMSSAQAFADEDHRVKTSARVHGRLLRHAKSGHVPGGRLYGYRNRVIYSGEDRDGNPLRSHVEREVHPEQAPVLQRLFTLFADGFSVTTIARLLNEQGAPSPSYRPKDGSAPLDAWASPTIRAMLRNEAYAGVMQWNRTRKRDALWGQVKGSRRDQGEHVRVQREDLRIIDVDLWERVQARRRAIAGRALRFKDGRLSGRPPKNGAVNLLAGLGLCGTCGGGIGAAAASGGQRRDAFSLDDIPAAGEALPDRQTSRYRRVYICNKRRHCGTCSNTMRVPVDLVNEAVLQAIEEHALTPEAIDAVIHVTETADARRQQDAASDELRDVEKRIARLLEAVEAGGDAASLVGRLKDLEARKAGLADRIAALRPVPRLATDVVQSRLDEWRRLLRGSVTQGRAVLKRILDGRIVFTPRADGGLNFECPTVYHRLFAGVAVERPRWVPDSRTGTEQITSEDTVDGDHGRLLQRAYAGASAENHKKTPESFLGSPGPVGLLGFAHVL
jgi:site-specific DNA recombinase